MGATEYTSEQATKSTVGLAHAGPTVVRILLGARLRRLREAAGITLGEAGQAIRGSHSKISRLELGRLSFKSRDVSDLLTLYRVHDEPERQTMLELARQANTPPWWAEYNDVVPSWFESYLGLEQAAQVIRCHELQRIPDLLQTSDYARAVIRQSHWDAPARDNERRVTLRMRRKHLLHRPGGPKLWIVLDEGALLRPAGNPVTMRRQLQHLIDLCELPSITLQVMPLHASGHVTNGTPITLLRFHEEELLDMVYLEHLTSATYLDKPADFNHYAYVVNALAVAAQPPQETPAILSHILQET